MSGVAVIFLALGGYQVVHAARNYGGVPLSVGRAEIRYLFGPPAARSSDDRLWRARDGDAAWSFLFDASDRLSAVGCKGAAAADAARCPDVLGLTIGDSEDAMWQKLGIPDGEQFIGADKVVSYPALGMRLMLRRAVVVAVERRRATDPIALGVRAISVLAP